MQHGNYGIKVTEFRWKQLFANLFAIRIGFGDGKNKSLSGILKNVNIRNYEYVQLVTLCFRSKIIKYGMKHILKILWAFMFIIFLSIVLFVPYSLIL